MSTPLISYREIASRMRRAAACALDEARRLVHRAKQFETEADRLDRAPPARVQGGYQAPSGGGKPAAPTTGSGVKAVEHAAPAPRRDPGQRAAP